MNRAVFFDRDGTLNVDKNYLSDPVKLELFPGTAEALKRLQDAGFKLFIVTNQSGIGRGYYTLDDMHRVNERLLAELARDGVRIEKIYFSPEAPEQPSRGRKPSPQFLFDARDEFGLDLAQSYMVGDKLIDLECGWNAGVKGSLLVRTGYGAQVEMESQEKLEEATIFSGLSEIANWIIDCDVSKHREKLQTAITTKGLSENQAAEQMGISRESYYDLMSYGDELTHCFCLEEIANICRALGITTRHLFADYAADTSATTIPVSDLINRILEYCQTKGWTLREFEEAVGWNLVNALEKPELAMTEWNVECVRHICDELNIDWFRVIASL